MKVSDEQLEAFIAEVRFELNFPMYLMCEDETGCLVPGPEVAFSKYCRPFHATLRRNAEDELFGHFCSFGEPLPPLTSAVAYRMKYSRWNPTNQFLVMTVRREGTSQEFRKLSKSHTFYLLEPYAMLTYPGIV